VKNLGKAKSYAFLDADIYNSLRSFYISGISGSTKFAMSIIYSFLKSIIMQASLFFSYFFICFCVFSSNLSNAQAGQMQDDKAAKIDFTSIDDARTFPLGKVDLVKIGGAMIGKAVFQPGWKWSESVKPIAKTESCHAPHFQYHVSGTLRVKMDDGTIIDCKPGDVSYLPKGHDAWVLGDEPVVVIDFQGMIDYAMSKKDHKH
jgi:hypothetical protein